MSRNKRREVRRVALEGAFVEFEEGCDIVGTVIDITARGLSFTYTAGPEPGMSLSSINADICIPESGFCVDDVPCRIMYDVVAEEPEPADRTGLSVQRQCGVAFGTLTKIQREGLGFLIGCLARDDKPSE